MKFLSTKNRRSRPELVEGSKTSTRKGFTLFETLIYMTVVSIIVTSLVLLCWNIISAGEKNVRQQEVYGSARLLAEKIKYKIRNADHINATSDFDVNLAGDSSKKISLSYAAPNNPTLINVVSGQARVTLGAASPVFLTPDNFTVTELTFTDYSSSDGKTKNIGFTLTITNKNPSIGNIYESSTIKSSAELRSN